MTKEVRRWDNINKILAQLLPSVVNRLPGSLCSSVSDDEPITVLSLRSVSSGSLFLHLTSPVPHVTFSFSYGREPEVTVGSRR